MEDYEENGFWTTGEAKPLMATNCGTNWQRGREAVPYQALYYSHDLNSKYHCASMQPHRAASVALVTSCTEFHNSGHKVRDSEAAENISNIKCVTTTTVFFC